MQIKNQMQLLPFTYSKPQLNVLYNHAQNIWNKIEKIYKSDVLIQSFLLDIKFCFTCGKLKFQDIFDWRFQKF